MFGVKDVYDHVNEVDENPFSVFVACLPEPLEAALFRAPANLIGDGTGLSAAGASGDDEIICRRAFSTQVEDAYICAVPVDGDSRAF